MTPVIYCETDVQGFMRKRVNHTEVIYTSWGVAQDNDVTLTSQPEALSRPVSGAASCLGVGTARHR